MYKMIFVAISLVITLNGDGGVPILVGGEADLDPCAYGKVVGLKKDGDGFLAVRDKPSVKGAMKDRLHNGDGVHMCDEEGMWIGIVYGDGNCGLSSPIATKKPYNGVCNSGWIYKKWVHLIAD